MHSESRRRSVSVNVRFTPAEMEQAHALAERLNCKSVPELLRLGYLIVQAEETRDAVRT